MNLLKSGFLFLVAVAILTPSGSAFAQGGPGTKVQGCKGNSAGRLARAARSSGLDLLGHRTVVGSSHGVCYVAAPLADAALAEADQLVDGLPLALIELDGEVWLFEAQADPAAIQEAADAWASGLVPPPGNATCRLVGADGTVGSVFACDLQAVKGPVSPDLPADGATLDAAALVVRDDAAGQAASALTIRVWVEAWGYRVCGSVTLDL